MPSYIPVWVDDLPKMSKARAVEQAQDLIRHSLHQRAQQQGWVLTNPPPFRIRRDPVY